MSSPSPSSASSPTVETVLDGVAATLRTHHATYLSALRTEGLVPLQAMLDRVLENHDDARTPLHMETPRRRPLWQAVRQYRRETMAAVWRPLRTQLADLDLGTLLRDERRAVREGRTSLAADVPEEISRPEPDSLYADDPSDDGWTRTRKAIVRGGRRVRLLWGKTSPQTQTVPTSALVARHAARTLSPTQADALDTAEQRIVQWTARLEREAVAWTHRLLEIERLLDRPEYHAPDTEVTTPPPNPDPTSGVMDADLSALYADITDRAQSLHQCLKDGRALQLDDVETQLSEGVALFLDRLRDAADRADSFMADRQSSRAPRALKRKDTDRRDRLNQWPDWFDEVTHRFTFLDALATLHDDLADQHDTLVADLLEAGLTPARSAAETTVEQLRTLRNDIDALLSPPDPGKELDLLQAFDHQAETGFDVLDRELLHPLRECTPRRTTQAVVESHRSAIAALLDEQPEGFVIHSLSPPDTTTVDPTEAYSLAWQEGCRAVLDEVLFDAWRSALVPVLDAVETTTERATEVQAVVQFHLGAALQELQDLREARRHDQPDDAYVEHARELALDGLDRAISLLETNDAASGPAAGTVVHDTWRATADTWTDLHDRMRAAGQARAHVLHLQGQLVRGVRWLATETTRHVRATTTQLQRVLHRAQRQTQRLVRLGHAAVGTQPVDEAALRHTVDALSTVDEVLADLPLVYRRLFSFRPIQDPTLLVARATDRAAVEQHVEHWKRGLTNALVLTGPAGSGRTSLLNVLRKTTFRTAQRHTIELTERVTSEAHFAEAVVRALGLSFDSNFTLEAVANHLQSQPVPDRLRVCFVEQFEHVFHRKVGGTALGTRILDFLSQTDTRVLWIATTTDAAWQFIEASEPAAARLVARHRLDPLDRTELEELIMTRHQRSGLGLSFEMPDETNSPILSRRLRAIDDQDRRQALLRTEFFDRLHDVCGQNVMLALFYWFRSVTLDVDAATLRVRPLQPVSFDVLDTLPLPHAFALKALLEHGTLTVEELSSVLGVSPATGRSLLETLGNALVIAPAERVEGPGVFQFASIEYETRYRIRPLLIHPVTRVLRSRNIVH